MPKLVPSCKQAGQRIQSQGGEDLEKHKKEKQFVGAPAADEQLPHASPPAVLMFTPAPLLPVHVFLPLET